MKSLGKRIKQLRKQKMMTLADLAGERLTKGMLSLIENGKAQPSMESMKYIAERLGVEAAVLLNDDNVEELRLLLQEIEEEYKTISYLYETTEIERLMRMHKKISSRKEQLQGRNYEEVRLIDYFLRLGIVLNDEDDGITMFDVIAAYEKMHAYRNVIDCYTFLAGVAFNRNDYKIALQFMQDAEIRVKAYSHLIDEMGMLDLHYSLTVLYAAVNDTSNTQKQLGLALAIARKNKVYYRLDDFYRFTFMQAINMEDKERSKYYLTKLMRHAEFTEEKMANRKLAFINAHYANLIDKAFERVPGFRMYLNLDDASEDEIAGISLLYEMEEAYAYWALGYFEQSLEISESFTIPPNVHHPLDLSIMYRSFAVRALCFLAIGDKEAAKSEILFAYHGVAEFPYTVHKKFIQEAYEKIHYGKKG